MPDEKQRIDESEVGKLEDVLDPEDVLLSDDTPKPINVNAGVAKGEIRIP